LKFVLTGIGLALGCVEGYSQDKHNIETADSIAKRELDEIVVTGLSARQRIAGVKLGAENIELAKMASLPVLFGENDIIKSITYLPGVHAEGDGSGGFEVRGGNASQNLIQLDGITLYNPSHVMGIFSTFNDNSLGKATLYKGPIPPAFGSATSSVLDTELKPGDMESYHASGTIGILAAKLFAEGPIVKDKLSFAVSARRSYVDMFLKMIPKYRSTVMNFYDFTAKFRYRPTPSDIIDLSFITGRDNMAISRVMGMHWGNTGVSASLSTRKSDEWRFKTAAAFNNYSTNMWVEAMNTSQQITEYMRTVSLDEEISYMIDDDRRLDFGVRSELLRVKSGEFVVMNTRELEIRSGWNNALWAGYEGKIIGKLHASGGIRLSLYSALSGEAFHKFSSMYEATPDFSSKTYFTPEPRLSIKYDISESHNIKAGMSLTSQDIHSIRSGTTSFPFDRYALSSATVRPERALQYGIGYTGMTSGGDFDWSVEGYYKKMDNVYDYRDGRTMFSEINLESIILGGRGRSYGAEFMLRKNSGHLTGWLSYTISKTETTIPGINGGKWYDATNDRRNDLSAVAIYSFNDYWSASASWIFSSGTPLTAPDVKYQLDGQTCYYYSRRNAYRTPDTHRLDLSATYTHAGKKLTYQWSFGIYNAYCRYNPYVVYFEDDSEKPSGTRAVQLAMFGMIPSVSYTLKF
ncbi:MAG: TonB-dependent receptor plug domain-containing protein, partial [Muribaculaceae bacterium]|nr:TonB-dependent receptor plug domain-containing protein [Muribaculaceae bacterium]